MSDQHDETGEQLADESLPAHIGDAAVPAPLEKFRPWHHPRKQFVRERQWMALSRRLLQNEMKADRLRPTGTENKPEIRYLTLPGIDYLDVEMMADVSKELGCYLTSTGFLAGEESHRVTARAKLREESLVKGGMISDRSHTFPRRLEDVASANSQAYRDLRRRAPFHIVNLDACGSPALPSAIHAHRLIDAIFRIVELQFEKQAGNWLLFLTTDVRPKTLSKKVIERFSKAIKQNASKNGEFAEAAIANLSPGGDSIIQAIEATASGSSNDFVKLFSMGFAKWLLRLAKRKQRGVKMHRSYCYSTPPDTAEITMPCLAFEFTASPPGLPDDLGVAGVEPKPGGTEIDFSVRIAEKVGDLVNLDEYLRSEPELLEEMEAKMKILLRGAGYAA